MRRELKKSVQFLREAICEITNISPICISEKSYFLRLFSTLIYMAIALVKTTIAVESRQKILCICIQILVEV